MNDFKNYGKGAYKYSYNIVKYVLNNYSKDEIKKLTTDTDYLINESVNIFEDVKNNRD